MYALLDHTAQVFLNPITFLNDGEAIRWFTTMVNDEKQDTNIGKYPEQFTLYRLADFDDKLGVHTLDEKAKNNAPTQIITGIQVQDEAVKKFTIKQLIGMLEYELQNKNVTELKAGGSE